MSWNNCFTWFSHLSTKLGDYKTSKTVYSHYKTHHCSWFVGPVLIYWRLLLASMVGSRLRPSKSLQHDSLAFCGSNTSPIVVHCSCITRCDIPTITSGFSKSDLMSSFHRVVVFDMFQMPVSICSNQNSVYCLLVDPGQRNLVL